MSVTNFDISIASFTPTVPIYYDDSAKPIYNLASLWRFFERPYGHPVNLINPKTHCVMPFHFCPSLFALEIFDTKHSTPILTIAPSSHDDTVPVSDTITSVLRGNARARNILLGTSAGLDLTRSYLAIQWLPVVDDPFNRILEPDASIIVFTSLNIVGDSISSDAPAPAPAGAAGAYADARAAAAADAAWPVLRACDGVESVLFKPDLDTYLAPSAGRGMAWVGALEAAHRPTPPSPEETRLASAALTLNPPLVVLKPAPAVLEVINPTSAPACPPTAPCPRAPPAYALPSTVAAGLPPPLISAWASALATLDIGCTNSPSTPPEPLTSEYAVAVAAAAAAAPASDLAIENGGGLLGRHAVQQRGALPRLDLIAALPVRLHDDFWHVAIVNTRPDGVTEELPSGSEIEKTEWSRLCATLLRSDSTVKLLSLSGDFYDIKRRLGFKR